MILLRCTIETTDPSARETCKTSLSSLRKHLRSARDDSNWDLADIFLNQCDEPISRVITKLSTAGLPSSSAITATTATSPHPSHHQYASEQVPSSHHHQAINVEDVVLQPLQQDFAFDLVGFGAQATGDLGFSFEGLGLPFENMWSGFDGDVDAGADANGMTGF
jgi:hypothetical protein